MSNCLTYSIFQQSRKRRKVVPILDTVGGAAVAYSIRKLNSNYTGYCLKVKRSSDNSLMDVPFNGLGYLDKTSLLDFVGTGSGYVTIWYDQSGNGRDFKNPVGTGPIIVNSGTLINVNGLPCLNCNTNRGIYTDTLTLSDIISLDYENYISAVIVDNSDGSDSRLISLCKAYPRLNVYWFNSQIIYEVGDYPACNIKENIPPDWVGNQHLLTCLRTTSNSYIYTDSSLLKSGNYTPSGDLTVQESLDLGFFYSGPEYFDGKVQEIIIYNSDQSTNRSTIESNINNFYSIY